MADLARSERTVDFVPGIMGFFAAIIEHRQILKSIGEDEARFFRTVFQNTYPFASNHPDNHKETLCIARICFIFFNELCGF
jgi:hypothetical protein